MYSLNNRQLKLKAIFLDILKVAQGIIGLIVSLTGEIRIHKLSKTLVELILYRTLSSL